MPLSLRPLLSQLSIKTTALDVRKFDLDYIDPDPTIGDWGWAQRPYIAEIERQYNAGLPVRIIVLKARQLGISTATEAVLFLWSFLHPGSNGLVVSHQDGQAQELFEMTKTYWDTWPHKVLYSLKYGTRRQMRWAETKSQIRVATAKNPEGLRGSTIQALHGSEVAFWPDPGTLWTGLNNTIPRRHGTLVSLESTANGVGNWFHEKWLEAEQGGNEFTPMFFPWYKHSAYRLHNSLAPVDLDADETELRARMMLDGLNDDTAMAAIAWRRLEIPRQGGEEKFMQEFPGTPEEAFIVSGHPIFPPSRITDCYDPKVGLRGRLYRDGRGTVHFDKDPSGPFTLYKRPNPVDPRPDRYFVAGDPSETVTGDPASIQVINRQTLEQVAVWHGRITPVHFAREMMLVGDFFHHAMLCPEVEGGGQATIGAILQAGYGNVWTDKRADREKGSFNVYGWSTNYQRKMWAIGELKALIMDRSLLLHDKRTITELMNYVEREDGTLGNSAGAAHDDTVMALAIAVTASKREGHFRPGTTLPSNPLDIFSSELEQLTSLPSGLLR